MLWTLIRSDPKLFAFSFGSGFGSEPDGIIFLSAENYVTIKDLNTVLNLLDFLETSSRIIKA